MAVDDIPYFEKGETAFVELWYPRSEGRPKFIQVGLMDVRSAGDIRISFDFERNGWLIEQREIHDDGDGLIEVYDWKETAFLDAWPEELEVEHRGDRR